MWVLTEIRYNRHCDILELSIKNWKIKVISTLSTPHMKKPIKSETIATNTLSETHDFVASWTFSFTTYLIQSEYDDAVTKQLRNTLLVVWLTLCREKCNEVIIYNMQRSRQSQQRIYSALICFNSLIESQLRDPSKTTI